MSVKPILLVVEDDLDVREAIVDSLSTLGIQIEVADNGALGLKKIKELPVCAVLSDINMPIMNGIDFLSEIRKQGVELPFVVLTAFADKKNTVDALRNGAMDFLDKPFVVKELRAIVQRALDLGVKIRELDQKIAEVMAGKISDQNESVKILLAQRRLMLMKFQSTEAKNESGSLTWGKKVS